MKLKFQSNLVQLISLGREDWFKIKKKNKLSGLNQSCVMHVGSFCFQFYIVAFLQLTDRGGNLLLHKALNLFFLSLLELNNLTLVRIAYLILKLRESTLCGSI